MIKLTQTEQKVLEFISKGTKDSKALMLRTGFTRRPITQAIRKLIDNGLVQQEGSSRSTVYKPTNKGA